MCATEKLYIIVRADLPAGLQISQSVHAARQFAACHPETERRWFTESNNVVILSVPDEAALDALRARAETEGIEHTAFLGSGRI